ncbi:hypothetical protein MIDIC_160010 [Alphaproteobacteria bacterium]
MPENTKKNDQNQELILEVKQDISCFLDKIAKLKTMLEADIECHCNDFDRVDATLNEMAMLHRHITNLRAVNRQHVVVDLRALYLALKELAAVFVDYKKYTANRVQYIAKLLKSNLAYLDAKNPVKGFMGDKDNNAGRRDL